MRFHVSPNVMVSTTESDRNGHGPCCTAHKIYPGGDAHLLAALHHLEGLVQQHLASERVVYDLDESVGERVSSSGRVLLHAYPPTESQLDDDAAAQGV